MPEAKHLRLLPVLAGCVALVSVPDARSEDQFRVTFSAEYTSGDYGAATSTDVLYAPFIGAFASGRHTFRITVPYISVTAPTGGVVVGMGPNGRPIRSGGGQQGANKRATDSGLGDIEASYWRTLVDDVDSGTWVDAAAKVKFGTADETRGLGTGANDYAVQLDLYQRLGSFTFLGTLGYTVFGDPPGTNFDNIWFGAIGASYRYDETGSVGLLYGYRQAATDASDTQRDVKLYLRHDVGRNQGLLAYAIKGYGSASPDRGFGLLFTQAF
jgi:hypothetical protein